MNINFIKILALIMCSCGLSSCSMTNNLLSRKTKTIEYYRIFDIKTNADRPVVESAASDGLGRNVEDAQEVRPIPNFTTPPEQPGRFKLVNPLAGTEINALADLAGNSLGFKRATCNGAIWIAHAVRNISNDSKLQLTACLWQYKKGYHLDEYAQFTEQSGGIMQISRSIAHAIVGTPEQWTEKTFLDVIRSIHQKTGAKITYLEGFPKMSGTPWLDDTKGE